MKNLPRPEALESRIAPAVFLARPSSFAVLDAAGFDAMDSAAEIAAAGNLGVDAAVLLRAGDQLFFDRNNDGIAGGGDLLLVKVATGQALVTMTDSDGDAGYDAGEIAGLVVGDFGGKSFGGEVKTDVDGSIVTALNADGSLAFSGGKLDIQNASIANLKISGAVLVTIGAGGSITNLSIGAAKFASPLLPSAALILTGTAADDNYNFGNGATVQSNPFVQAAGTDGGSISKVTLARGSSGIVTGDGGNLGVVGPAGSGGSVNDLTVLDGFRGSVIVTGKGGNATEGVGGAGGGVARLKFNATYMSGNLDIETGPGGNGGDANPGGAGGAISAGTVTIGESEGTVDFTTGAGGDGGNGGNGGVGGGIRDLKMKLKGELANNLRLQTGGGGNVTAGNGVGGTGGEIARVGLQLAFVDDSVTFTTGPGGDSTNGAAGTGGAISLTTVKATLIAVQLVLTTGDGGTSTNSRGGASGAITDSKLTVGAMADANIGLRTGDGGGGGGAQAGGVSGDILRTAITATGPVSVTSGSSSIKLETGTGGDGGTNAGTGGKSGTIADTKIKHGAISELDLVIGGGGNGGATNGSGGATGDLTRVQLTNTQYLDGELVLRADSGGAGFGTGDGGDAGTFSAINVKGPRFFTVRVEPSSGGSATGSGTGGAGGSMTGVNVAVGTLTEELILEAGTGGPSNTGIGGAGGRVDKSSVTVTSGEIDLSVTGGFAGNSTNGGVVSADGGGIADFKATFGRNTEVEFNVRTGRGGNSKTGTGGAGGNLERVSITSSGFLDNTIQAERGGDNQGGAGNGGAGGALRDLTLISTGHVSELEFFGGRGGNAIGNGNGGGGGEIARLNVATNGGIGPDLAVTVFAGGGGASSGGAGDGGKGGDATAITIADKNGGAEVEVGAGFGGSGVVEGGDAGVLDGLTLAAPFALVTLGEGSTGGNATTATGIGGSGGTVKNVKGRAGRLDIFPGNGGNATTGGADGGAGGGVEDINVAVTYFAGSIFGGVGGNGGAAAGGTGGTGGDVLRVKITGQGDVGNFAQAFGTFLGGLGSGAGGTGNVAGVAGSIDGVTAKRIAAIYATTGAVAANNFVARNAVTAIANITAAVIGSDFDGDTVFDFTNAGAAGFGLGQGDTVIDGLVIVKAGGFDAATIPTVPLLKIEV